MSALENLWNIETPPAKAFDPITIEQLPPAARNYLTRAIAPGTPIASAIRFEMAGEIKLNGDWLPFTATQVVRNNESFVWQAHVVKGIGSISGYDQLIDGKGEMNWKILGLIPVMSTSGPDTTRSAAGRMATEFSLLPTAQLSPDILWKELTDTSVSVRRTIAGYDTDLTLAIDEMGRLISVSLDRWGNPDDTIFHFARFGVDLSNDVSFGGYTIPTKIGAGWHYGASRFDEGEFFRAEITSAEFK